MSCNSRIFCCRDLDVTGKKDPAGEQVVLSSVRGLRTHEQLAIVVHQVEYPFENPILFLEEEVNLVSL